MHLPKLFTPDVAPSASFVFDESGDYYFTGGTAGGYGILVKQPYDRLYVLSLLNSRLIDWRLSKNTSPFRSDWRSYEYRFIKELPIRRIDFTTPLQKREQLRDKARNLSEHCTDDDGEKCLLSFVEHHLCQEPEEADVVHDLLAHLAREMIRLNQRQLNMQREFIAFLAAALGVTAEVDDRDGVERVGTIKELVDYVDVGWQEEGERPFSIFWGIINRICEPLSIGEPPKGVEQAIQNRYEQYLKEMETSKNRLRLIDRMIDQVVYRLYALSQDEINIVEGGTPLTNLATSSS
jgi:hypothetical protein